MDWFERLMGFREEGYASTRAKLTVDAQRLTSLVNGMSYDTGTLELVSLSELRDRAKSADPPFGKLRVSPIGGDVRDMHRRPEFAGALFQVASQFNLLEMVDPGKTPEDGVTIYQYDGTQGPACAMAAGAATIYRNYFADIGGQSGQTQNRQLDALADLGALLSDRLKEPVSSFWTMRNGYALCTQSGLDAITGLLDRSKPDEIDELRGSLRIGLHYNVEITDAETPFPVVTQAFCSALPVAYSQVGRHHWAAFAALVLEAAYEATLWAAVLNASRGKSDTVLLTSLGGGAFGNDESWILGAIARALDLVREFSLDVRLVSFGPPSPGFRAIARQFGSD
jgi:hypothetical protein